MTRRSIENTLVAGLVLCLGACATTLPRQRPEDLTISMTRSGAHADERKPVKDELVLSKSDDSHYKVEYEGGGAVSVALDVSDGDLDEIYEALRESGFDHLSRTATESKHEGGTHISVQYGGQEIAVHLNGQAPPSGKWKQDWDHVVTTLKSYKKSEIEQNGIAMPATFDPTEYAAGCPVQKVVEVE